MPDDHPTISSSRLSASDVARHTFGQSRRGFDPHEVRSFLESVSREMQVWEQREHDLRAELADAEDRALHPVLDEATLSTALGQQSANVLRAAHDEAARIVAASEEEAATLAHQAQRRANEVNVAAETASAERIAQAELAVASIHQQSERDANAREEAAREESERILARAREQGRALVERAQHARREVLADLAQRRRDLHLQIEQFRAARDELAATVLGVRGSVDDIVSDLIRADDDARAAAAEVARRPQPELEDLGDIDLIDGPTDGEIGGRLSSRMGSPREGPLDGPIDADDFLPRSDAEATEHGNVPEDADAESADSETSEVEAESAGAESAGAGDVDAEVGADGETAEVGSDPEIAEIGGEVDVAEVGTESAETDELLAEADADAAGKGAPTGAKAAGAPERAQSTGGHTAADHGAPESEGVETAPDGETGTDLLSTEDDPADAAPGEAREAQSVEDLFARIRASRGRNRGAGSRGPGGSAASPAPDPAGALPVEDAGAGRATTVEAAPGSATTVEAAAGSATTVEAAADGVAHHDEAEPESEREPDDATTSEDRALLRQRADLLDPVVARLTRRVKRALQDDQNRLLDKIRSGSGRWSVEALGSEEEQSVLLVEASSRLLKDAYAAGAAFAREHVTPRVGHDRVARADQKAAEAVNALAGELAGTVTSQLRRRLEAAGAQGAGGADDVAELVGVAYREWRGERIERLVGDVAVGAFSSGVLSATDGAGVRWLPANGGSACPDCDDNSLAGSVAPGLEFPTGHAHPPAHAGCRCLVTPTPA